MARWTWKTRERTPNSNIELSTGSSLYMIGCGISTARQSRVPFARNTRLSCQAPIIEARFVSRWPKPNLIGYQTRLLRFHALSRLPPCLSPQAFFCRMRIFPGSDWMGIVGLETAADGCMQMLRVRPVKWPVASAASTPGRGDRPVPALNPLLLLHAGAALRLHSAWGNESPTTTRFSLLSTVWSRDHGGTVTPSRTREIAQGGGRKCGGCRAGRTTHGIPWVIFDISGSLVAVVYVDVLIEVPPS